MEMKKLLALYPQVVTFSSVIYAELIPVSQAHCITDCIIDITRFLNIRIYL